MSSTVVPLPENKPPRTVMASDGVPIRRAVAPLVRQVAANLPIGDR